MLRYGPGDWNALHRDLYGELVFPLQVVIGLDEPGRRLHRRRVRRRRATPTRPVARHGAADPAGPRRRLHDARPPGAHTAGWSKAPMRHGVSVVRSGRRHTLGLVFHDAA